MSDGGDRVCNLECVTGELPPKRTRGRHEFVGPVKIILVDPIPGDYMRKAWGSGALAMVNLYIGATFATVLFFTLCFRVPIKLNVHIIACTIGFQLFMPTAIMMLNPLFGGASHLKESHKRFQHLFLQHLSLAAGIGGGFHVLFNLDEIECSAHTFTGVIAMGSGFLALVIGPLVYCFGPSKTGNPISIRNIHTAFGMISFLMSSICLSTGLFKPSFMKWSRDLGLGDIPCVLVILCFCYTMIIFLSISWRSKIDV